MPAKKKKPLPKRRGFFYFSAVIKKKGINAYLDLPAKAEAFFQIRGNIPVTARLSGQDFAATLIPVAGGRHLLYVNQPMLRASHSALGSSLRVGLRFDPASRMPAMLPKLSRALVRNPGARRVWAALRPSRRKEILRYLRAMKRPESLERNILQVMKVLSGKARRLPAGMQL